MTTTPTVESTLITSTKKVSRVFTDGIPNATRTIVVPNTLVSKLIGVKGTNINILKNGIIEYIGVNSSQFQIFIKNCVVVIRSDSVMIDAILNYCIMYWIEPIKYTFDTVTYFYDVESKYMGIVCGKRYATLSKLRSQVKNELGIGHFVYVKASIVGDADSGFELTGTRNSINKFKAIVDSMIYNLSTNEETSDYVQDTVDSPPYSPESPVYRPQTPT